MATSTHIKLLEIGSFVNCGGSLCIIKGNDRSMGYSVYTLLDSENGEEKQAFTHQIDPIDETQMEEILMADIVDPSPMIQNEALPDTTVTRFVTMTEEEKETFKKEQQNKNTIRKTKWNIKLLTDFLVFSGENRNPCHIPPEELSGLLDDFFCVRKQDGE